jgi:hypothetical protein
MINGTLNRLFIFVACCTAIGFAVPKADYSGTYVAQQKKGKAASTEGAVLHVTQTDAAIEVTRTEGSKITTSRFPLDGTDGDYVSSGGVHGRCRGQLKDKYLELESMVAPPANAQAPGFVSTLVSDGSCHRMARP